MSQESNHKKAAGDFDRPHRLRENGAFGHAGKADRRRDHKRRFHAGVPPYGYRLRKAAPAEMDGVPHHLIDVLEPWEEFNVTLFQKLAKEAAEQIYAKGRIPIVAGGTGFYIQALLYDVDFTENDGDMEYRNRLAQLSKEEGPSVLHENVGEG